MKLSDVRGGMIYGGVSVGWLVALGIGWWAELRLAGTWGNGLVWWSLMLMALCWPLWTGFLVYDSVRGQR